MSIAPFPYTVAPEVDKFTPVASILGNPSDPILYWNAVALEANRVSHSNGKDEQTGPPLSARALAIVHLAMYDAYAGILGNPADLPSYLGGVDVPVIAPGDVESAAAAAVAGAAHRSLSILFPSQKTFFDTVMNQLVNQPINPFPSARQYGVAVADKIMKDREGDPGTTDEGYQPSIERGRHRVDPDNPEQGFHAPFYGGMARGFAIQIRHVIDSPKFLDTNAPSGYDAVYEDVLREVRDRGISPQLMGTLPAGSAPRKPSETLRGIYWGYDGSVNLGTPPRMYNQIVRVVATHKQYSVAENARLFALVNVAMADAGILAWEQKYHHDFWRPVVGIREHDRSMGPDAMSGNDVLSDDCDAGWLPLGAPTTNATGKNFSPPFPAYPSGHATFCSAALHMVRLFDNDRSGNAGIGDDEPDTLFDGLGFVSEEYNGTNMDNQGVVRPRHIRKFEGGLWDMIVENGMSRVDLGVHWSFDAFALKDDGTGKMVPDLNEEVGGVWLGIKIAKDIFNGGLGDGLKYSNSMPLQDTSLEIRTISHSSGAKPGGSWLDRVPYLNR